MPRRVISLNNQQRERIIQNLRLLQLNNASDIICETIRLIQQEKGQPEWMIDSWGDVKDIYDEIKSNLHIIAGRQSWNSGSGQGFQKFMQNYLNTHLNPQGIGAASKGFLQKHAQNLVDSVSLALRRQCTQQTHTVWQDSDIAIITRNGQNLWKLIAIASCKTSFHARETEACYYALFRQPRNIKQLLLTVDADNALASCAKPNKVRALLETHFDRVFSANPITQPCAQIAHIEANQRTLLIDDILAWRNQVVRNFISTPLTQGSVF